MRRVFIVFFVLALALLVGGCGASTATTITTAPAAAVATTATLPPTTASALPRLMAEAVPVGTSARVGDWSITVESVDFDTEVLSGGIWAPVAGNQYVLVNLKATYHGDEPDTFYSGAMFVVLDAEGNEYYRANVGQAGDILGLGDVSSGQSVTGSLVFSVRVDRVSEVVLAFYPVWDGDQTITLFALRTAATGASTATTLWTAERMEMYVDAMYGLAFEVQEWASHPVDLPNDVTAITDADVRDAEAQNAELRSLDKHLHGIQPPTAMAAVHQKTVEALDYAVTVAEKLVAAAQNRDQAALDAAYAEVPTALAGLERAAEGLLQDLYDYEGDMQGTVPTT